MTAFTTIGALAARYDAFLLDLWGVVHDGRVPYPGVIETLEQLRAAEKRIVFLSNAPRRAARVEEVLEKLGIGSALYDGVMTSGEAVYRHLAQEQARYGTRYYYIGPEKDQGLLDGLAMEGVDDAAEAEFALVTGFDGDDSVLEEKLDDVEACVAEGLPLICANPDKVVVRQSGERLLCAGVIAEEYEARGGAVEYFGKPYGVVYQHCLAFLDGAAEAKIVAVGDGLETDIAGAQQAGIHAVLCTGGILAAELGITPGEQPSEEAVTRVCEAAGVTPDAAITALRWE